MLICGVKAIGIRRRGSAEMRRIISEMARRRNEMTSINSVIINETGERNTYGIESGGGYRRGIEAWRLALAAAAASSLKMLKAAANLRSNGES